MKNKNLNWIFVLLLIVIAISFFSCNKDDNPIKPTPPSDLIIDSNFFDWKIDTIGGTLGGLDFYVADTNKIFIPGSLFGIFINNGTIIRINYLSSEQYFQAYCVNGTNENNVYFGGCKNTPNGKAYPRLKKWDGSSITNIPLPEDTCSILNIE
ncbi:MAG: hypothetical protein NTU73_05520, partial [Ignavibacteriae bacterium]|nr:hypothetical protein [Ignavibacteriota bacterium]